MSIKFKNVLRGDKHLNYSDPMCLAFNASGHISCDFMLRESSSNDVSPGSAEQDLGDVDQVFPAPPTIIWSLCFCHCQPA